MDEISIPEPKEELPVPPDYLASNFPNEFKAICALAPVQKRLSEEPEIKLSELSDIVFRYRRRFADTNYSVRIESCIKAAESAQEALRTLFENFIGLDLYHRETVMTVATVLDPQRFPTMKQRLAIIQNELYELIHKLNVICPALKVATGVSGVRTRGRPCSPYIQVTMEVMELWERIAKIPLGSFPAAKNKTVRGKHEQLEAAQVSTEFCRLVFSMIKPEIKLKEVRTAINDARKATNWILQRLTELFEQEETHDTHVVYDHFIRRILAGKEQMTPTRFVAIPFLVGPGGASEDN